MIPSVRGAVQYKVPFCSKLVFASLDLRGKIAVVVPNSNKISPTTTYGTEQIYAAQLTVNGRHSNKTSTSKQHIDWHQLRHDYRSSVIFRDTNKSSGSLGNIPTLPLTLVILTQSLSLDRLQILKATIFATWIPTSCPWRPSNLQCKQQRQGYGR